MFVNYVEKLMEIKEICMYTIRGTINDIVICVSRVESNFVDHLSLNGSDGSGTEFFGFGFDFDFRLRVRV